MLLMKVGTQMAPLVRQFSPARSLKLMNGASHINLDKFLASLLLLLLQTAIYLERQASLLSAYQAGRNKIHNQDVIYTLRPYQ